MLAGNITTGFSMRTDSAFTTQGGSNMGVSRGHMGAVYKEHLSTWITGGGATAALKDLTLLLKCSIQDLG